MSWNCRMVRGHAFDFATERATEDEMNACRAHVIKCDKCRSHLAQFNGLWGLNEVVANSDEILESLGRRLEPEMRAAAARQTQQVGTSSWLSKWWLSLLLPAAVAAAVFVFMSPRREAPTDDALGTIASHQAHGVRNTALWEASAEEGPAVHAGQRLTAAVDNLYAKLGTDYVAVMAQSAVELVAFTGSETRVRLTAGRVVVDADPQAFARQFVVETSFGEVSVKGTLFEVSVEGAGEVATVRGLVGVTAERAALPRAEVAASQRWVATETVLHNLSSQEIVTIEAAVKPKPGTAIYRGQRDFADKSDVNSVERENSESDGRPLRDSAAVDAEGSPELGHSTKAASRDAASRSMSKTMSKRLHRSRRHKASIPRSLERALNASQCDEADQIVSGLRLASTDQAEMLTLLAECHLAHNQKGRALALYRRVVDDYGQTSTAQNALFEVARLSNSLGDYTNARDAFVAYIRRYPQGDLTGDARFHVCALEHQAKRFGIAETCLAQYQNDYPTGLRLSESLLLSGRIKRDTQGDCVGAARYFKDAFRKGAGAQRESAAYEWVACLRQTSNRDMQEAIDVYLKTFPRGKHLSEIKSWRK
ncbi:MAG: tetratricopeptide repeat protein [Myxococcota bacterium]